MTRPALVSLVLPCRNQADHIGAVLPRYLTSLERLGAPFELIVVPNASTDATQEVIGDLAKRDGRIRVVPNPLGGWGLSVRTGLEAARGAILAYTNTARTNPESVLDFLRFHRTAGEGGQGVLVKARREHRHAPLRAFGSMLYNVEARACFGLPCRDVNGTPKVFSRELYDSITLTATGDLVDLELLRAASRRGVRILEIPLQGFTRHGGKSSTTLKSAWKMYAGALRFWLTGQAA